MPFSKAILQSPDPIYYPVTSIFYHFSCDLILTWGLSILELLHSHLNLSSSNRLTSISALSISWTSVMIPFTPHYNTSPFPLNFVGNKAINSNFPFLKTSTTSSLFAAPFITLTYHVPSRFTQFCRVIQDGSGRHLRLRQRLDYVIIGKKETGCG